jgi:hypothetical protein
MGSPLSPVIASFLKNDSEEVALECAANTPLWWFQYVDDTFAT